MSTNSNGKAEVPSKPLSRRTFFEIAGALAFMFGLGGVVDVVKSKALLRPPGGQNEASFSSKCLKCDKCRSICPTSVIAVANLQDGVLDARTPKLNFHLGYCTYCRKCIEVCPTQALEDFEGDTVVLGVAAVDRNRCIAWKQGGCELCYEQCPYAAISLDSARRPVVNTVKCVGCGLCETICPALQLLSYLGGTKRGIVIEPGKGLS